jgi:predicted Rossmann fold nucleotide-binding protein DprA/Smf involved in DNA uptake
MGLRDESRDWGVVLAALYLAGSPHGLILERRRWPAVLATLRAGGLDAASTASGLRAAGCVAEGTALESAGSLDWAVVQADAGRVATCLDADYPERWLAVLGDRAPPALWRIGMGRSATDVAVVGSRDVEPEVHRFCAAIGREAAGLGYRVVSGGAMGCDSAALRAAAEAGGETLVLAPHGIDWAGENLPERQVLMSACDPAEGFSRGRAMERNALIYASSRVCVVGQARFREGGTWHGAVDALRRRLCAVWVRKPGKDDSEDSARAARALVALGARYLESPSDLGKAIAGLDSSEGLFGTSGFGGVSGVA